MTYATFPAVDENFNFPPEVRAAMADYQELVDAFATKSTEVNKENKVAVGTAAQYYRGDKTWQTLNKAAVGLSAVDNTSDVNKPVSTATNTAISTAVAQGMADTITNAVSSAKAQLTSVAPRTYGEDYFTIGATKVIQPTTRYSAFPVQTKLNDGRILMVWYEATDHIATRDGQVVGAYSSDLGKTWSVRKTFVTMTGIDLRDPTVSTSTDGKTLYLTYIKCTAAKPRDGFFLIRSTDNGLTWTPEVRIDPVGSNGAGTAPIKELANGKLLAVWFGATDTEAYDSVFRATSSDGGNTWSTPYKFANGVTDTLHYEEPYAAVFGNHVVIMYRHGMSDRIGVTHSTDSGVTWSAPSPEFSGTGRPSCVFTSNGTLVVVYRDAPNGPTGAYQHAILRSSPDFGSNWTSPKLVERADPQWMIYSCPIEIVPGVLMVSTAIENGPNTTTISIRYVLEGAGISPFGDTSVPIATRVVGRTRGLAITDTFDRADGPVGLSDNGTYWLVPSGPSIVDGALQHSAASGPHVIVGRVLDSDMEIEAELSWTGLAGSALVFRYQDATNYLMMAIEASGTALRVYQVVNGTATEIGTTQTISAPEGYFHRVKVSAIGNNIRCYFEDELIYTVADSTYNDKEWAGVRLGVASTSLIHRVRNFTARRRGGLG